jgi:hypothetical protein
MAKGVKTGGRQAGTVNKATKEFRDTVTKVLEMNAENVAIWLAQVANGHGDTKPAPDKALDLMAKLAEFAAPKLARTEHAGELRLRAMAEVGDDELAAIATSRGN